jgi:hypothetical protein
MRRSTVSPGARLLGVLTLLGTHPLPLPAQQVIALPADDHPLPLGFQDVYTLGGLNVEPWQEFQAVSDAAFGPDGRLYILDGPSEVVLAVSPEGRLLHHVGRPGQGPGEYGNASGLAALPDGRVAVWDFSKRAFLLFGRSGESVGEVRPDFAAGLPDGPFVAVGTGHLLAFPFRLTSSAAGLSYLTTSGVRGAMEGLPILRIPIEDGAPVEILTTARLQRWRGSGDPPIHRAFQPWPSWGPLAGGDIALHQSDEYRIEVLAPDGAVERVLTRPLPVRETGSDDREAYARDLRRRYEDGEVITMGGSGGTPAARMRAELDRTWYYPSITPVLEITADGVGHVWVLRRDPEDPTRPGPVDILSMEGRYLGTLADDSGLPLAFGPGGLVAFVAEGAWDVPVVRVRRLLPRGG